jgi:cytochrome P450
MVFDPQALHHILVKDQHIYEESDTFVMYVRQYLAIMSPNLIHAGRSTKLLFGQGLLSSLGEQHRKQRKMLNPVFSIAHMRAMSTPESLEEFSSHLNVLLLLSASSNILRCHKSST